MKIKPTIGQTVTIKNYAKKWNGSKATVQWIDGFYTYVHPFGYPNECILEVYWERELI